MKTQMQPLPSALALLVLLSATNLASAYYDPGVQRWINRDPLSETGFEVRRGLGRVSAPLFVPAGARNNFLFVGNSPLSAADSEGLTQWEPGWPGDREPPPFDLSKCKGGPDPALKYVCFTACAAAIATGAVWIGIGSGGTAGAGIPGAIVWGYAICSALCDMPPPGKGYE